MRSGGGSAASISRRPRMRRTFCGSGTGAGVRRNPESFVEEPDLLFGGGFGLAFEWAADHSQHFDGEQRGPGNKNALVGSVGVRGDGGEAVMLDLKKVIGHHAFEHV